ncbi:receptor-like kinase [Trifolium pratense]|uniref:Receptor-like kinase n=1 Tax=Trifolium pratense TaxID=57577 RepID=A0A2K3NSD8_TRIPR|nr:receptor-like kinase [Trifolium pratense]
MLFPSSKLPQEYGELWVRQLREFNLALLGKWCWRLLTDGEGLWFRVLAARYRVEGGKVGEGGRRGSEWWREIVRIHKGFDGVGWRLFDLGENKLALIDEIALLGWGIGGQAWVWRRQLWAWEEELLGEWQALLLNISLQDHISDRWQWQLDPVHGYFVGGAYQLLTSHDMVTLAEGHDLIWHR